MKILVDSSVWIDYFNSGNNSDPLDLFLDQNVLCINDLILSEIIPVLKIQKQNRLINLLYNISNVELKIRWQNIIDYQILCIKNGIKSIGIPDLIILDNVIQNKLRLFTLDKHFFLIKRFISFEIINN